MEAKLTEIQDRLEHVANLLSKGGTSRLPKNYLSEIASIAEENLYDYLPEPRELPPVSPIEK